MKTIIKIVLFVSLLAALWFAGIDFAVNGNYDAAGLCFVGMFIVLIAFIFSMAR